jgi:glycosyltransferase involved in cell wall biosynthesis
VKIIQVSTFDIAGGAEKVAWGLFQAYRERQHESWLAVGTKRSNDPNVIEISPPKMRGSLESALWRVAGATEWREQFWPSLRPATRVIRMAAGGRSEWDRQRGREDFNYPHSRHLLSLTSGQPDIVHCHNLHTAYFDLRYLQQLSTSAPTVITLHDEWLLTGHCACTLGCSRWEIGCGQCPDLSIYPSVQRDATAWNWKRKHEIYRHSKLHVATPSAWLRSRVERSMLGPTDCRTIPYGVNHTIFCPAPQATIRHELGIPIESLVLLFVANFGKQNPFKDYATLEAALNRLCAAATYDQPVVLIALGGKDHAEWLGNVFVKSIGFVSEASQVARYYQAADVYVHAAHTDNFPNSVLEALSCGLPVVATGVGGIPEQIVDGETGYLVPAGDATAMADRINLLFSERQLRKAMGERALNDARGRFGASRQVDAYIDWYGELLAQWPQRQT